VVGPENKAVRKDVTLGDFADELRIVRSGLGANDKGHRRRPAEDLRSEHAGEAEDRCDGALPPAAMVASGGEIGKPAHGFLQILHRPPDFAAVLSIVILVAGLISMPLLPISEYPDVVPPTGRRQGDLSGANPKVIAKPSRLFGKNRSTAPRT